MSNGSNHIVLSDNTHPDHPLVKAAANKGLNDFDINYVPKYNRDFGWWIVKSYAGALWLAKTMENALRTISKI